MTVIRCFYTSELYNI